MSTQSGRISHPCLHRGVWFAGKVGGRRPIGNAPDAIGEPVRIAHLVPTLHPDGPEIGLVDLAQAAPQVGMELVVIALAVTSDTTQVSALRRLGCPGGRTGPGALGSAGRAPAARVLRDRRATLLHTHLPPADVVGAAAAPALPASGRLPRCTGWRTSPPTASTGSSAPPGSWPGSGS